MSLGSSAYAYSQVWLDKWSLLWSGTDHYGAEYIGDGYIQERVVDPKAAVE